MSEAGAGSDGKRARAVLKRRGLNDRLSSYCASAAIAWLGAPATASAAVVYTPFNYYLSRGGHCVLRPDGLHPALELSVMGSYFFEALKAAGINGGEAMAVSSLYVPTLFVPALAAGQLIGPSAVFSQQGVFESFMITSFGGIYRGDWESVSNGYLGFRFEIKGRIHYGWARMTTETDWLGNEGLFAWVTGLAYETVPGRAIAAGDEAGAAVAAQEQHSTTLGALAFGAKAIPMWRKATIR